MDYGPDISWFKTMFFDIVCKHNSISFANHVGPPPYLEIAWVSPNYSMLKRDRRRGAMKLWCLFANFALLFLSLWFTSLPD